MIRKIELECSRVIEMTWRKLAPASAARPSSRTSAHLLSRSCFSIVTALVQSVVPQRSEEASEMKSTKTQKASRDSDSSLFSNTLGEGWTAQATKAHCRSLWIRAGSALSRTQLTCQHTYRSPLGISGLLQLISNPAFQSVE